MRVLCVLWVVARCVLRAACCGPRAACRVLRAACCVGACCFAVSWCCFLSPSLPLRLLPCLHPPVQRAIFEDELQRFQDVSDSQFVAEPAAPRRIKLNIGGQTYETTDTVLKRDPSSLLAALVGDASPLQADEDGCFFIDRDGMLFRHILRFLRDGVLPANRGLLQQLLHESEYFGIESLRESLDQRMGLSSLLGTYTVQGVVCVPSLAVCTVWHGVARCGTVWHGVARCSLSPCCAVSRRAHGVAPGKVW